MLSKAQLACVVLFASVVTSGCQTVNITISAQGNPVVKNLVEKFLNDIVSLTNRINNTISNSSSQATEVLNNIIHRIQDAATTAGGSLLTTLKNIRAAVETGLKELSNLILNTPLDADINIELGTLGGLLRGLLGILLLPLLLLLSG